jgi:hypothetical protein
MQTDDQTIDIYDQYISFLKSKQYNSKDKLEKYRIIPGHDGGTYSSSNVLLCTFKEHTLAHFYRYLSLKQKGDLIAYTFMSNQTEKGRLLIASYAGQIGGKVTSKKNKANKEFFYSPEWQKIFGDKNAGKRNLESGFLDKLNAKITKETPDLRSKVGKLGGKTVITKQKLDLNGMFSKDKHIQRKGNLVRSGIVINNVRIPYKKLSSDIIDHYIMYGNPFK